MTASIGHALVVVPARDEASTLAACLSSVVEACAAVPALSTTIVLVLDRCTDDSAAVAARFPAVATIAVDVADVGRARARGVEVGLQLVPEHPHAVWIATTDADSTVPRDWLIVHERAAAAGADAFVGAVVPVLSELDGARRTEWLRRHSPGATLGHVHGANLGVRGDAYRRAGGFLPAATGEDVSLVRRLRASGFAVAESEEAPVVTSSRLTSRVDGGYARYLADLAPGLAPGVAPLTASG